MPHSTLTKYLALIVHHEKVVRIGEVALHDRPEILDAHIIRMTHQYGRIVSNHKTAEIG